MSAAIGADDSLYLDGYETGLEIVRLHGLRQASKTLTVLLRYPAPLDEDGGQHVHGIIDALEGAIANQITDLIKNHGYVTPRRCRRGLYH